MKCLHFHRRYESLELHQENEVNWRYDEMRATHDSCVTSVNVVESLNESGDAWQHCAAERQTLYPHVPSNLP